MWSKQSQVLDAPSSTPAATQTPAATPFNAPSSSRSAAPAARSSARLGSSLQIKGQITGSEDLQIDGKVDGPITLSGHGLTVGPSAELNSEVHAGEVIVFGKVVGNVHARGRVDIRKDGCVVGDIDTARISIEDGAQFRGRIEIDPAKARAAD
jgi:cytoskeletal protein CcmA (bactofilin family)